MGRVEEQPVENSSECESGGRDGCCEQVDAKAEGEGRATDGDGESEGQAGGQGGTARLLSYDSPQSTPRSQEQTPNNN